MEAAVQQTNFKIQIGYENETTNVVGLAKKKKRAQIFIFSVKIYRKVKRTV